MTDVERIVASLTEAQKRDISESGDGFFWSADGRTARGLERKGLIGPDGRKWYFTPLGLAVRARLEQDG